MTKRIALILFIVILGIVTQKVFSSEAEVLQSTGSNTAIYSSPVLNVYTWVDYLNPEIVSDFEKEFNVKVNIEAAFVNQRNSAVKFVIPKEGTGYWVETVAVPIGAKNKRLAEEFLNFMLRPENGARHTNYSHYANCNKRAWPFVNKELLRNPYIYINRKTMNKLEVFEILVPDVQNKYNECWAELLSN